MSKPVKDLVTKEITARFGHLDSILVVNPIGMNAIDTNKLRMALRTKKIEMEVVKNALAQRGLLGTKIESASKLLEGSCALVTGGDSIVEVAREIFAAVKKYKTLQVRGAVVEGQVLDPQGAEVLSKMPNRAELFGQVVTLAKSPGSRLASQIAAPASRIAGCIKAVAEKLEKDGGSAAAA
jgi:large subunit ribosomal protein L10